MKQVKDLGEKEVIWCKTLDECEMVSKLLDKEGLKWNSGSSYLVFKPYNECIGEGFCFRPKIGKFDSLTLYREEGYTIHHAKDFFPEQDKMKISLENYLRNKVDEFECMQEYSVGTDSIRAWIDVYKESSVDPVKEELQDIIREWHESKFQKPLINILRERMR